MTHTDKSSVLAQAILDKINTNKVALGLDIVLYGDHKNIPNGKSVTVMPSLKRRDLAGVSAPGGRTENTMEVLVTVYNSTVTDEASSRLTTDQLGEAVETLLHSDVTMGGIIIHGYVTTSDSGLVFIEKSMFRAVQMTYIGRTKTYLTVTP